MTLACHILCPLLQYHLLLSSRRSSKTYRAYRALYSSKKKSRPCFVSGRDLSYNYLTGSMPLTFQGLRSLQTLSVVLGARMRYQGLQRGKRNEDTAMAVSDHAAVFCC